MLIKGRKLQGPNKEIIVLPRGDEEIVLTATAILDFDPFERACPEPVPPTVITPGKGRVANLQDAKYKLALMEYQARRLSWLVLESLKETEGLVWETVKYDDPNTWNNYQDEMKKSGFTNIEIGRVISAVMSANSLSEEKIEQARARFLARQEQMLEESSSLNTGQQNMRNGELVKGLG